ncbi:MAG: hypothetical protein MUO22_04835 [Sedimentisphaerales bacterium]|nr:hypothetical protein [Sedimentisphaerales bacterium]
MQYANKVVMTDIPKLTMIGMILSIFALPGISFGAGHFTLAFQRQLSAWENSSSEGCLGGHVCRVWVWDEEGNEIPDVQLKTTWDVLMGATDIDGRAEIPIWTDDFDLKCVDGEGATSDSTLLMTTQRPECWGHYSFEVGFLYKSDVSNPGEFDLDLNCSWNDRDTPQDDDAPYTKSLAYSGVDCTDYWSDISYWGNWQDPPSYFGQTFVATGDRVVSARVHGVIEGLGLLDWQLRIVTFPGLQPVGGETSVPVRWPFGWEAFWGVDDCPVVPGQTYMLQAWRNDGGMNIYHVTQDVYPQGQYYEGTTAFPGLDLNGHICCMNYFSLPDSDFDNDGKTDFADYSELARHWSEDEPSADIGPLPLGDGTVNFKDLAVLVENWLIATKVPPLPGPASSPNPANDAIDVDMNADLVWAAGPYATSHDVYFGIGNPPQFVRNQSAATYEPGTMVIGNMYYWRIDAVNVWGKDTGTVWSFTTRMPHATNPNPSDGATGISTSPVLSWTADPYATSHEVSFGTSNPPPSIRNQTETTFEPGTLNNDTKYYWRIDEVCDYGTILGTVWEFTTAMSPPP